MKAILWKEIREHARWVPLGAMPFIAILVMAWRGSPLVVDGEAMAILVGIVSCPIAAALGILQCRADQRPDARALLIHRGITIDAVFFGKLLAGMLLYAATVFLPLLGLALYIAVTGLEHRAAHPGVLLGAGLSGLAAFVFWPAAMLVVHRDAWFLGSRLLPAVAAGVAVFVCSATAGQAFWFSIGILLLSAAGFGAAARSVFSSSGGLGTGVGRASLALIVTTAILTGVMCAAVMVETYRRSIAVARGEASYQYYSVTLGADGEPWLSLARPRLTAGGGQYYQIAKMIPGASVRDELQPLPEDWQPPPQWTGYAQHQMYYGRQSGLGVRFLQLHSFHYSSATSARYQRDWVYDKKGDTILLYEEGKTHRWTLRGRLRTPTAADSFRQPYNWYQHDENGNFTLVCSAGVYRIPGNGAGVEVIYRVPPASVVNGFQVFSGQANPHPFGAMLRVDDRMILLETNLTPEDKERATSAGVFSTAGEVFITEVPLPNELANRNMLTLARAPDKAGAYVGVGHDDSYGPQQFTWMRFDGDGQIKAQKRFEEDTSPEADVDQVALVGCVPPALFGVIAIASLVSDRGESLQTAWDNAKKEPKKTATLVFLVALQALVGVGIAVFCARRRRLERRSTLWWMLWGLLLGPAGGLASLAAYPRVALDACGACRKMTRLDLSNCEHCDHPFDEPSRKGIEIIDNEVNIKQQEPAAVS